MKQKIKIMRQKPELSDEEIRSYMNFDGLMARRKLVANDQVKVNWFRRVVPIATISAIAVWFVFYNNTKTAIQPVPESVEQNLTPNVTSTTPIKEEINEGKVIQRPSELAKPLSDVKPELKEATKHQENKPLENIYVQAEPLQGYDALYEYFNSQLVYPAEAIQDSIQGVQTISFVINSDGKPENILITQSLGEPFEKEARRLIEQMPSWKPASLNGKPVSSRVSLPLTFQIQKVKSR